MIFLITQNIHLKILKYLPRQSLFFFVFFKAKSVILLYIKIKKPKIPLFNNPSFLDLGGKKIFLLL
jgi:hypothetical protein